VLEAGEESVTVPALEGWTASAYAIRCARGVWQIHSRDENA
jgi:hypothetical protein